ncbi:HAD-IIB family hydrolase [Pseudooceanicola sp. CBS1P-1]|uniref:HAD hydrolase family protein n=1 Tax=Pseudooceanicola albus TaxID=2692189 RepID=A0A6L7G6P9_9RHOB|nr:MULTISPECIES: HAD-IIB family hydrolase [Pseudooceanicola]MBT9383000.1 HAD-IIB family hydrolase [Pseudooceanicola endophyticus]MXN19188.1 HAD hydrolase family protein [Pseudooceanicola albus]
MQHPPFIVFTDLDGTLLDHASYGWDPARPALEGLARHAIPVILASSKTGPEIAALRARMGLSRWPAIVENGAGLLPAETPAPALGPDYQRLRALLEDLPAELRAPFRGFGDLGPDGVAEDAGLSPEGAAMACRRSFSEPGLWDGDAGSEAAFIAALAERGVTARRGGRYLTLSFGGTKADRMAEIAAQYDAPRMVALGDAPNDREMLETADLGFIIGNPHGTGLPPLPGEATGQIRRSTKMGPEGWNEMIQPLLSNLTET